MNTGGMLRLGLILGLVVLIPIVACTSREEDAPDGTTAGSAGTIQGQGLVETRTQGTITSLFAEPAEGWRFDHWEGPNDRSTENPHYVGTSRVAYYTAVFVQRLELTVSVIGQGSVESQEAERVANMFIADAGSALSLSAVASTGWCFGEWSEDLDEVTVGSNSITVTLDTNQTLTAVFVPEVTITVTTNGEGDIETKEGQRVDGRLLLCPESEMNLQAVTSNGWCFDHWSGDFGDSEEVANSNSLTLRVEEDLVLAGTFVREAELTVELEGEGTVEVDNQALDDTDPVSVCPSRKHTLKATASTGWRFLRWSGVVGDFSEEDTPITVSIDRDLSIKAEFVEQHELTVRILSEADHALYSDADTNGTAFTGSGVYDAGEVVEIHAHVPVGWEFVRWLVSDGSPAALTDPSTPTTSVTVNEKLTVSSIVIDRTRQYTLEIRTDTGAEGVPFVEGVTSVALASAVADCDFGLVFSPRGYFLACWSELENRPESEHAAYGGIPVRNTFFHGEAVTLSACDYVITSGVATFSGRTEYSSWSGDANSSTDTITLIVDSDKTINAVK